MSYKELIIDTLKELNKLGHSREHIEIEMGYSPNYIDQVLSKGGNAKFYEALLSYQKKQTFNVANTTSKKEESAQGDDFMKTIEKLPLNDQAELLINRVRFVAAEVDYYKAEADRWKKLYFDALNNSKSA